MARAAIAPLGERRRLAIAGEEAVGAGFRGWLGADDDLEVVFGGGGCGEGDGAKIELWDNLKALWGGGKKKEPAE